MAILKISDELKNVIKQVIADTYFPVGALYASFNNVDPNNFLLGTWVRISGAYLMAGDPNSTMEHKNIGGAVGLGWIKTTGSTTLTAAQSGLPRHEHDMYDGTYGGYTNKLGIRGDGGGASHWVPSYAQTDSYSSYRPAPAGGDSASEGHTHTLPYYPAPTIVLNVWRRTA